MANKKTDFERGVDVGYFSCAYSVLSFMSEVDKQHVQNLAENLGVTHKDMVKIEEAEISFEDDIAKNSNYWN